MSLIYGASFLAFGNMAGNAIQFGIYMQMAVFSHSDIALPWWLVAIFTALVCFAIHAMSRRFGLWLNNAFAIMKLSLVLLMVVYGVSHATASSNDAAIPRDSKPNPRGTGESSGIVNTVLAIGK